VAFGLVTLLTFGGFARTGAGEEIVWNGTFDGRFEDRVHAIEILERHNEEVKRRVPPERLLVYEVKEGWGPLCEFLGVPEPDEPFPRLNDAAEMRRGIRTLRAISLAVEAPDEPFPHLNDTREMRRRLLGLAAVSAAAPVLVGAGIIAALTYLLRRPRS